MGVIGWGGVLSCGVWGEESVVCAGVVCAGEGAVLGRGMMCEG